MTENDPIIEPATPAADPPISAVPHVTAHQEPSRPPGLLRYMFALLATLGITLAGAYITWVLLLRPAWETRVSLD